jgi:hypothetical protein
MAKFPFPVDVAKVEGVLRKHPDVVEVLKGLGTEDNVEFLISCAKQGYTNKMYHKVKQEEDRLMGEIMKNDPGIRKAVEERLRAQGSTKRTA